MTALIVLIKMRSEFQLSLYKVFVLIMYIYFMLSTHFNHTLSTNLKSASYEPDYYSQQNKMICIEIQTISLEKSILNQPWHQQVITY